MLSGLIKIMEGNQQIYKLIKKTECSYPSKKTEEMTDVLIEMTLDEVSVSLILI